MQPQSLACRSARRRLSGPAIGLLVLAGLLVACTSAHAQACFFSSSPAGIGFGSLDPSSAATRIAFTDVRVFCLPLSFTPAWQFAGANGNAPLRMKHATQSAFVPYTVASSFTGMSGFSQSWRLTATVLGPNYQNALVGSYSDLLTVTVTP